MDFANLERTDSFRAMLVDPKNLDIETGELEGVVSGTITDAYNTTLKQSGSLTITGDTPIGNNLVRIYYETTLDDETVVIEVGTFFVDWEDSDLLFGEAERELELYSTLYRFTEDVNDVNGVYGTGTDILTILKANVQNNGGTIFVDPGVVSYPVGEPVAFEVGKAKIENLNYFADVLNCGSFGVDTHGRTTLKPYVLPADKPISYTFTADENCLYEPGVSITSTENKIPNRIVVSCPNGDSKLTTKHDLPAVSPYSFYLRGRYVTEYHDYTDLVMLSGSTTVVKDCKLYAATDTSSEVKAEMVVNDYVTVLDTGTSWVKVRWNTTVGYAECGNLSNWRALEKKADDLYANILAYSKTYTITGPYAPVSIGDAVRFIYRDHEGEPDIDAVCLVQTIDRDMTPFFPSTIELGHIYEVET